MLCVCVLMTFQLIASVNLDFLLLFSSSWWGERRVYSLSTWGSELAGKEIPDPRGDPHLPPWHCLSTRSRPLLWHFPANHEQPGLPWHLPGQTLVALSWCGAEQWSWRLRSVLSLLTLLPPGHVSSATVGHDASHQPSSHRPDADLRGNRQAVLCSCHPFKGS